MITASFHSLAGYPQRAGSTAWRSTARRARSLAAVNQRYVAVHLIAKGMPSWRSCSSKELDAWKVSEQLYDPVSRFCRFLRMARPRREDDLLHVLAHASRCTSLCEETQFGVAVCPVS